MPGRLKDARLRLHVACEPGWRDAVVAAAAAEGESLSAYVRTAVDARLSGRARAGSRRARGAGRGEPGNCAAPGAISTVLRCAPTSPGGILLGRPTPSTGSLPSRWGARSRRLSAPRPRSR